MPPIIDEEKCTSCGICFDYCSEDVFFGSDDKMVPVVSYPEFCVHCSCCVYACPAGAIKLRIPFPLQLLYKELEEVAV